MGSLGQVHSCSCNVAVLSPPVPLLVAHLIVSQISPNPSGTGHREQAQLGEYQTVDEVQFVGSLPRLSQAKGACSASEHWLLCSGLQKFHKLISLLKQHVSDTF